MSNLVRGICLASTLMLLAACEPERGSEDWCEDMDETPKGDWSVNDATEYAKSCVLRQTD